MEIARLLSRVADILEAHEANPFRVRSYRRVAEELRALRVPAAMLHAEGGRRRLQEIPGVGIALSSAMAEILETGGLRLLERLEAEESPVDAFTKLPGVGPKLAHRIHDELGVSTLEELESAAYDGRLLSVEGIGEKRARGIRDVLSARLARPAHRQSPDEPEAAHRPSVALLLDIDREYRRRARLGELRRIAPRRFNPEHEAWLPIMELEREGVGLHGALLEHPTSARARSDP